MVQAAIKALTISTVLSFPTTGVSETVEEMSLQLLNGRLEACTGLGKLSIKLADERQTHWDFQIVFDDLNASWAEKDPGGLVTKTVLFMTKYLSAHPRLEHPKNIEKLKADAYARAFDYCRYLTEF